MNAENGWLGLDIGGANLKSANTDGFARQVEFPLWKQPEELSSAIADLIGASPVAGRLAVTMTGELADCFPNKAAGVGAIVDAVERAAAGRTSRYYNLRSGGFVDSTKAKNDWLGAAASNWHALAAVCGRVLGEPGLLIDVGSTTTDIVAFDATGPCTKSITDTDRLLAGELLYQGVGRTPVCAVVRSLPLRGSECPVAAELFATTADAAVLLGLVDESDHNNTADGRPATKGHAAARLARMACADAADLRDNEISDMAQRVVSTLEANLAACLRRRFQSSGPSMTVVVSGAGEWLARSAVGAAAPGANTQSLGTHIGQAASVCAPAWAVALLAEQQGAA